MKNIIIDSEYIKLDQFLKLADIVMSGGEAKLVIMSEEVQVNGEICTQRGKKLKTGDLVEYKGQKFAVK
ncbi:RNA-binding S4 domain-containing protein [Peptostreptococcus russellii]|uniref:RNA-binding S4 domain-containing protein n=1 Tax=Peptostreptococcus russellii TaxID=215200 RepID=UPI002942C730|nr:RNA-binding S4 domain-containing protein [Peptostreptococcus russellii]